MKTYLHSFVFGLASLTLVGCLNDDDDEKKKAAIVEPQTVVDVAVANGNFTTLVAALQATGLDSVLDDPDTDFTMFAPTDAAFELLGQNTISALLADTDTLSDILLYHVVSGAEIGSAGAVAASGTKLTMANGDQVAVSFVDPALYINTAMVTLADVAADNGVIHVIDAVILPPTESATPALNIVETAVNAGSFTTLVAALQAAGLDTTLADASSTFTVFAPTDDAFNALPAGTVESLLADPSGALTTILLNHVIADAAVDSITAMTLNGQTATTAAMQDLAIEIMDGKLMIGGATVTTADIYTSNGIIHVIDTVITE